MNLRVKYKNQDTATAQNAFVQVTLDPKLIYLSASIALISQNGNVFTFNMGDINVDQFGGFNINIKVDCDATLGEMLCANAHIFPDTNCLPTLAALSNNNFCMPVVASFDPNDKTAFIDGRPDQTNILPDLGLEYLIRFQNTGTDTAFNIVIVDTLMAALDGASVVPGASSHPYNFELREGRILRVSFKNILLPDSNINEAASHGFVKFFVRQKTDNPLGLQLKNQAAIYFDFNAPVMTNQSIVTVQIPLRTTEAKPAFKVKIWPQPATENVTVSLNNEQHEPVFWQMRDALGRLVQTGETTATQFFIERKQLAAGTYFLQFSKNNSQQTSIRVVFN